jgi:DNA-binding NtrC family response regulator
MARKLSTRTWLHRMLATSALPIYVVNPERRLVFCNPACAAWTGVGEQQLLAQRCDYHSSARSERSEEVAAALCPPPEAFRGQWVSAQLRLPGDEASAARWAHFLPLSDPDEESLGVLVWVAGLSTEFNWPETARGEFGEAAGLHEQLQNLRRAELSRYLPSGVLGQSPAMGRVREQIRLAATGAARVVVVGPPGSGREHVARAVHYGRGLPDAALIPLACGLLDAELLEATVAAVTRRTNDQEPAWNGALLLQDVEQLTPHAQAVLFDLLARHPGEVRTLATSRVALQDACRDELFRDDLAFALSTLVIELPALADRKEDLGLLAQCFVEEHNATGLRQLSGLSRESLELLAGYDWPGNVDELSAAIGQACRRAAGPWVIPDDLPEEIRLSRKAAARAPRQAEAIDLDHVLGQIEAELFRRAMRQAKGNKTRAAQLLGLTRARFHRRLAQLGLGD